MSDHKTIYLSACPCCKHCPTDATCDDKCQGIYSLDITFPAPYAYASVSGVPMVGNGCTWSWQSTEYSSIEAYLVCGNGKWYLSVEVCLAPDPPDGSYENCTYTSTGRPLGVNGCPPPGAYVMGPGANGGIGDPCGAAPTVNIS